jgi:branched-chain amino acid transport system substrate-binding protein
MKRRLGSVGLILGLVFLLVSMVGAQQKPLDWDNPIKIGYINPFTGPATLNTSTDLPGVYLAIEEINAAGGVLGRPLKVITRDDKLNPEHGLREVKDLVVNEKVFWIQGTTSSAVARAVSDYMKNQKAPIRFPRHEQRLHGSGGSGKGLPSGLRLAKEDL